MTIYDAYSGDEIPDYMLDALYRDALDDIYGLVTIAGYEYDTGATLEQIDPIAFRTGLTDWIDSRISDGTWTENPDE